MTLRFEDGRPFASGAAPYRDHHPSDPTHLIRLVVQIDVLDQAISAAIDTGGAYLVLDPEYVEYAGDTLGEPVEVASLKIRGDDYQGDLYRLPMVVSAEDGRSLELEVTAFVPRLSTEEPWLLPPILGLKGCLERFRFAVDPGSNTWFFGSIAPGDDARRRRFRSPSSPDIPKHRYDLRPRAGMSPSHSTPEGR
jgi:hypothetical protein